MHKKLTFILVLLFLSALFFLSIKGDFGLHLQNCIKNITDKLDIIIMPLVAINAFYKKNYYLGASLLGMTAIFLGNDYIKVVDYSYYCIGFNVFLAGIVLSKDD